jgi:ribosomal protein S18 acetylase RimI-like enzyme
MCGHAQALIFVGGKGTEETMAVEVREAGTGDEAAVAEMIGVLAAMEGDESPVTPAYVAGYLDHAGLHALLAESGGRVVGLLTYSFHPGLFHASISATIDELVVRPESQGAGVGDALMAEVMRRIEAAGCAEASVSTGLGNSRAQALYRKHGLVDEALLLERHFP